MCGACVCQCSHAAAGWSDDEEEEKDNMIEWDILSATDVSWT